MRDYAEYHGLVRDGQQLPKPVRALRLHGIELHGDSSVTIHVDDAGVARVPSPALVSVVYEKARA